MTTRRDEGMPQRLSMVTLGVEDLPRSRAFYERLGFVASSFESDAVAFFDMGGTVLALFGRAALAEDANMPQEGQGFRAVSCAINVESETAVDRALALARECGARITQPARQVFWGGYSGYFADPDGHLWEVAFNPIFPLDENGRVRIPGPGPDAHS